MSENAMKSVSEALEVLEEVSGETMQMNAVGATRRAKHLLEAFLDGEGDVSDVNHARDLLEDNRDGAIGDARDLFDEAIELLEEYLSEQGS